MLRISVEIEKAVKLELLKLKYIFSSVPVLILLYAVTYSEVDLIFVIILFS